MKRNKRCKSLIASKFTLVELLITIAIIAILAAMLLPTLNKARDKAKSAQCLSNFKQLGLATGVYLNDNGDLIVQNCSWSTGTGTGIRFWPALIMLSTELPASIFHCPGFVGLEPTLNWTKLRCTEYNATGNWYSTPFAMNGRMGFGKNKVSRFKSPSACMMFIDGYEQTRKDRGNYYLQPFWTGVGDAKLRASHSGQINMAYSDGHADSLSGGSGNDHRQYSDVRNPYRIPPFNQYMIGNPDKSFWEPY